MKRKQIWIILCFAAFISLTAIGQTIAYFHDEERAVNDFTMAEGVDIELTEPGWKEEEGKDLMPGDFVTKDPTIQNLEDSAYTRIILTFQDEEGNLIRNEEQVEKIFSMLYFAQKPLTSKVTEQQLETYHRTNPLFSFDNTRSGNGVYYFNYSRVMEKNEKETLFTGLAIPADWKEKDINEIGNFEIVVEAQGIQTKNIADANLAYQYLDGIILP